MNPHLEHDEHFPMADEPKILISLGKEKINVTHTEEMTFGDVRIAVAALSGQDGTSFRFLCKGRAVKDEEKVATGPRPALVKIMALKTKKGHQADAGAAKKGSSSAHLATEVQAANEKEDKKSATAKIQAVKPTQPKGDVVSEDEFFVMVRAGRERYHVRIELSCSIQDLKDRLENMDGVGSSAKNMKLIFSGKQRKNEEVLQEIGVKRGSMFMLLFLARHHDAVDAKADLQKIKDALIKLESQAKQVDRQFDRRLMDIVEVRARLGEIEGEAGVLKNQLESNKCEDDIRQVVLKCMENMEAAVSSVRDKLSSSL